jgi:hypothetical protein
MQQMITQSVDKHNPTHMAAPGQHVPLASQ